MIDLLGSDEDRTKALEGFLVEQLRRCLRLPASRAPEPVVPMRHLGLDSLMALEVKNHLEQMLGIDLPVVKLLQGPTIEELATEAAATHRSIDTKAGMALSPRYEVGQPAPLSAGQQAMWVLQQLMPGDVSLNVASAKVGYQTVQTA